MKLLSILQLSPPFESPSAGVARFHVYRLDAAGAIAERIALCSDATRSLSLDDLLDEGQHRLAITRQDVYGQQSTYAVGNSSTGLRAIATIEVVIGEEGEVVRQLVRPQITGVLVEPDGYIRLSWQCVDVGGIQQRPAAWEIAEASDLDSILLIVTAGRVAVASTLVGPFSDAAPTTLALRASDGIVAGRRGAWVMAPAVTVDLTPPPIPAIVT